MNIFATEQIPIPFYVDGRLYFLFGNDVFEYGVNMKYQELRKCRDYISSEHETLKEIIIDSLEDIKYGRQNKDLIHKTLSFSISEINPINMINKKEFSELLNEYTENGQAFIQDQIKQIREYLSSVESELRKGLKKAIDENQKIEFSKSKDKFKLFIENDENPVYQALQICPVCNKPGAFVKNKYDYKEEEYECLNCLYEKRRSDNIELMKCGNVSVPTELCECVDVEQIEDEQMIDDSKNVWDICSCCGKPLEDSGI